MAGDRIDHRRAEEEERLDRFGQREAGAGRLSAVESAHLLCLLEQELALGLLRRGNVLDHQLEGALAPAAELVALLS